MRRTTDPWRDTDVIDARAPRTNQAVVGSLSLVALVTGWWPLYAILALQLGLGLSLGRRWCLTCLVYFEVLQPRFGEGPIEDSRPPRFANQVGLVFLTAVTLSSIAGIPLLGQLLGGIVAALALLAATTGLCVGCELYRALARVRGLRQRRIDFVDLRDFGTLPPAADEIVIQFTHPLCTDCHRVERELRAGARPVVTIDVARRPELARKYGVTLVPTAVAVTPTGLVTSRIV